MSLGFFLDLRYFMGPVLFRCLLQLFGARITVLSVIEFTSFPLQVDLDKGVDIYCFLNGEIERIRYG